MPPPSQGMRNSELLSRLSLLVVRGNDFWEVPDEPEPKMQFEVVPDEPNSPEFEVVDPDEPEPNLRDLPQWEWEPGAVLEF